MNPELVDTIRVTAAILIPGLASAAAVYFSSGERRGTPPMPTSGESKRRNRAERSQTNKKT